MMELLGDDPCIIAEVGCNHGGDAGLAAEMVAAAAGAGARFVKLQTYSIDEYVSRDHPAHAATAGRHQGYIRRAIRLIDSYLPITGHHTFGPNRCTGEVPYNIPASRFLRPYTPKLRWFDPLKKKRILASLRHAATHKQAFHLWWHPHNFGRHLEQNAGFLERILQEYRLLSDRFGMRALSMSETAKELAFWTKPLRGRRLRPLDVEL